MHSKVNSNGQVTIPAKIRKKLGIEPQDNVYFELVNGKLCINTQKAIDPRDIHKIFGYTGRAISDEEIDEAIEDGFTSGYTS